MTRPVHLHPKDESHALLQECALLLLDAVDIMCDGPDDSDIAMAQGRLASAHAKAKAWRQLNIDVWKHDPVYAQHTGDPYY